MAPTRIRRRGSVIDKKIGRLNRFGARLRKLKNWLIGVLASAMVVGCLGGFFMFAVGPIKQPLVAKVTRQWADWVRDRKRISKVEAKQIVRQRLGSAAVDVQPFLNDNDDTQYILAWLPTEGQDCKISDKLCDPNGNIEAVIIARFGNYQFKITKTNLIADRYEEHGLTDWNNDGTNEVLGLTTRGADGSAPHDVVRIKLFDTGTSHFSLLTSEHWGATDPQILFSDNNPPLRGWLSKKAPYLISDGKEALEGVEVRAQTLYASEKWERENGGDFVSGFPNLTYFPGLVKIGDNAVGCDLIPGKTQLANTFKGSLYLNDLPSKRSALLYKPDGLHHRELPGLIVGRRYVWLKAAVDSNVIAIDKKTLEFVLVAVAQWKDTPPADDGGVDNPEFFRPGGEAPPLKEHYVNLDIGDDGLTDDTTALTLSLRGVPIPSTEFTNAVDCSY